METYHRKNDASRDSSVSATRKVAWRHSIVRVLEYSLILYVFHCDCGHSAVLRLDTGSNSPTAFTVPESLSESCGSSGT